MVPLESENTFLRIAGLGKDINIKEHSIGRNYKKTLLLLSNWKDEKIIKFRWVIEDLETTLTDPNMWISDTKAMCILTWIFH
jgi:hypothetical protein